MPFAHVNSEKLQSILLKARSLILFYRKCCLFVSDQARVPLQQKQRVLEYQKVTTEKACCQFPVSGLSRIPLVFGLLLWLMIVSKTQKDIFNLYYVTPFIGLSKRKLLLKPFFTLHFSYCPLIWMCHSSSNNRNISMLYER